MYEKNKSKSGNSKVLIILISILIIMVITMGIYIIYNNQFNYATNKNITEETKENTNYINNESKLGNYNIYISSIDDKNYEYTLTLYNPKYESNNNYGFFSIAEAGSFSYNEIGGYYKIVDSKIEFRKMMTNDEDKFDFVNFFGLTLQDLQKESSDEQDLYYKLILDYDSNQISSMTHTYNLVLQY